MGHFPWTSPTDPIRSAGFLNANSAPQNPPRTRTGSAPEQPRKRVLPAYTSAVVRRGTKVRTDLWRVRCVKKSELSEGFVRRRVGAVGDRGAGALSLVLGVGPLRGASVQARGLPRRRGAVGEDDAARRLQVGRGAEAFLVPELHVVVVVVPGPVQRAAAAAAAALQPFVGGAPSHRHRRVNLGEARFSPGAVVYVVDRVVLAVAGGKL